MKRILTIIVTQRQVTTCLTSICHEQTCSSFCSLFHKNHNNGKKPHHQYDSTSRLLPTGLGTDAQVCAIRRIRGFRTSETTNVRSPGKGGPFCSAAFSSSAPDPRVNTLIVIIRSYRRRTGICVCEIIKLRTRSSSGSERRFKRSACGD